MSRVSESLRSGALDHPRLWEEAGLHEPEWEVARLKVRSARMAVDPTQGI